MLISFFTSRIPSMSVIYVSYIYPKNSLELQLKHLMKIYCRAGENTSKGKTNTEAQKFTPISSHQ